MNEAGTACVVSPAALEPGVNEAGTGCVVSPAALEAGVNEAGTACVVSPAALEAGVNEAGTACVVSPAALEAGKVTVIPLVLLSLLMAPALFRSRQFESVQYYSMHVPPVAGRALLSPYSFLETVGRKGLRGKAPVRFWKAIGLPGGHIGNRSTPR